MEFDLNKILENLKEKGNALSSFGKEEDDDNLIRVKDNEVTVLSDKKDEDVSTSTVLESGDASEAEKIYQKEKGVITTKDKKKESEEDLEKKLKNIEKVIETFGGNNTSTLPSSKELTGRPSDNINLKPLDFSQLQAKANQQEYLKPSNVQNDRIALLYKDLEKYNLI